MSKRILVVEDQPDNRQIIRDMLAPTDYVDWFGTVRGRLGYVWGNNGEVMSYVTGGLAYAKVDLEGTSTSTPLWTPRLFRSPLPMLSVIPTLTLVGPWVTVRKAG